MGYTHYYTRKKLSFDKEQFKKVVADFSKLLPLFEQMGIPLSYNGEGKPEVNENEITFNGLEKCGHTQRNLGIAWPAKGAKGVALVTKSGENVDINTIVTTLSGQQESLAVNDSDVSGTWFAGCKLNQRTCGGDCSHESFNLEREIPAESYKARNGDYFSFTKTAYKPYDLAVISALIIAKHHLGKDLEVSSDGDYDDWSDGMILCEKVLGYGLDFRFTEED